MQPDPPPHPWGTLRYEILSAPNGDFSGTRLMPEMKKIITLAILSFREKYKTNIQGVI